MLAPLCILDNHTAVEMPSTNIYVYIYTLRLYKRVKSFSEDVQAANDVICKVIYTLVIALYSLLWLHGGLSYMASSAELHSAAVALSVVSYL